MATAEEVQAAHERVALLRTEQTEAERVLTDTVLSVERDVELKNLEAEAERIEAHIDNVLEDTVRQEAANATLLADAPAPAPEPAVSVTDPVATPATPPAWLNPPADPDPADNAAAKSVKE